MRTTIKAWMSSNFGRIRPLTLELFALERLKKTSYNLVSTLAPSFLSGSSSYLQVARTTIIYPEEFEFQPDSTKFCEVSSLEGLKKFPKIYNGQNLVSTLAPSFLIGCSSFLQVTRTTIKAWMSSNLGRIPPLTSELVALECLKNRHIIL